MKWQTVLGVNTFLFIIAMFINGQFDATAADEPLFSYPEALITAAGLAPEAITKGRAKFKKDPVHREWMQHVHLVVPDLEAQKEKTVVQIHTSFLYIKNALDQAYRRRKINQNTFTSRVGALMAWFQQAHSAVLNPAQYDALFPEPAQEEPDEIDTADEPLGFPVENSATSIEMIQEKFDARTIEAVKALHQQRKKELAVIGKAHKEGSLPAQEFENIRKELHINYISNCRDILTDEQFELLFGSVEN